MSADTQRAPTLLGWQDLGREVGEWAVVARWGAESTGQGVFLEKGSPSSQKVKARFAWYQSSF